MDDEAFETILRISRLIKAAFMQGVVVGRRDAFASAEGRDPEDEELAFQNWCVEEIRDFYDLP